MITCIVIGCYAIAWLYTARRIYYVFREADFVDDGDLIDYAAAGFFSFFLALLWPLALPMTLVMWHPRKTPAELREQLKARDRRIAELEREAGIRPG